MIAYNNIYSQTVTANLGSTFRVGGVSNVVHYSDLTQDYAHTSEHPQLTLPSPRTTGLSRQNDAGQL